MLGLGVSPSPSPSPSPNPNPNPNQVKGRAKEEGKLPKARKGKGGARADEVEVPLRITSNQYRKFAEEDEPKSSRARRISGVD